MPYCVLDILSLTTDALENHTVQLVGLSIRVVSFAAPISYMTLVHHATIQKHDKFVSESHGQERQSLAGMAERKLIEQVDG